MRHELGWGRSGVGSGESGPRQPAARPASNSPLPIFHFPQTGFALPAALFLLVVLGGLSAWLMRMTQMGMAQDALEIEGERAYQAAQAGLEAGLYAVTVGGVCTAQSVTFTGQLSRFTASVTCAAHPFDEGGVTATLYEITSVACNQPGGSGCPNTAPTLLEYSERAMRAVVEQ